MLKHVITKKLKQTARLKQKRKEKEKKSLD